MKKKLLAKVLSIALVLAMAAVWLPMGAALAADPPADTDGLIPFWTGPALLGDGGDGEEEQTASYIAVVGDFAVPIDQYLDTEEPYPSQEWIEITLQPADDGDPLTRDFYTGWSDSEEPVMPRGALFLGNTPAGVYEMSYGEVPMGTLEVLAVGQSKVLSIGGAEEYYGRPDLDSGRIQNNGWLRSLFESGYINGRYYYSHNENYYYAFRDGVYLSLIAANIKPADITTVQCGGETVDNFDVIPVNEYYWAGTRQYLIRFDASALPEVPPEDEGSQEVEFSVTVKGVTYDVTLENAESPGLYLDLSKISKCELGILSYGKLNLSASYTAKIFGIDDEETGPSPLFEQELTRENGRYTLTLPSDLYLFEDRFFVIGLYSDAEAKAEEADYYVYVDRIMITQLYFQRYSNTYLSHIVEGEANIPANLNGRIFTADQYLNHGKPVYDPDFSFSLIDADFAPVSGVTIERDHSILDWDALDDFIYRFDATRSLTVGQKYYLCLGDLPLLRLNAVSSLSPHEGGGGEDGDPINEIDGTWETIVNGYFYFYVSMPRSTIQSSEWSVTLTNLLPGSEPVTYSVADETLWAFTSDDSHLIEFLVPEPLAAGVYRVQYFRGETEVEAKYEEAGADEFYYVDPSLLLVLPDPWTGLYINEAGLTVSDWENIKRAFYVNGYTTPGGTVSALTADFYASTLTSYDFNAPKTINLPAVTADGGGYFYTSVPLSELTKAGLTPGFYYVVIRDGQGNALFNVHYHLLSESFLDEEFTPDPDPDPDPTPTPSPGGSKGTAIIGSLVSTWQNPFMDVKLTDWFYSSVQYVTQTGLMNGTSSENFSPFRTTSRGMLLTALYRMAGSPTVTGEIPFKDVAAGQWYSDAILWASQNDIAEGFPDGNFGWNQDITREQAAAFFYRYAQFKNANTGLTGGLSGFVDEQSVSDWARDAVAHLVAIGVISGRPGPRIAPKDGASRAELATMLARFEQAFMS